MVRQLSDLGCRFCSVYAVTEGGAAAGVLVLAPACGTVLTTLYRGLCRIDRAQALTAGVSAPDSGVQIRGFLL